MDKDRLDGGRYGDEGLSKTVQAFDEGKNAALAVFQVKFPELLVLLKDPAVKVKFAELWTSAIKEIGNLKHEGQNSKNKIDRLGLR